MKGATPAEVKDRLQVFNELRVQRVAQVVRNTRAAAPIPNATKIKSANEYSDYYWSYKITEDATRLMNEHGYSMRVKGSSTGVLQL